MEDRRLKGALEYLKESFKIYFGRNNFLYFIQVSLLYVVSQFLFSLPEWFTNYIKSENFKLTLSNTAKEPYFSVLVIGFWIIFAIVVILFLLISAYLTFALSASILFKIIGKYTRITDSLKYSLNNYWNLFGASFVITIIIVFGYFLLIIPGIIFTIWYCFSLFLVMDKGIGIKQSLIESKKMVEGKFWGIMGRSIVVGLFYILLSFIVLPFLFFAPNVGALLSLIMVFFGPIYFIPLILMYRDLKTNNEVKEIKEQAIVESPNLQTVYQQSNHEQTNQSN